ncbi:uncharacterized protein LOC143178531 [Calliopsis andreniformis]|uniref:uncharacterized protein LOC143178531 n=1 Tax=Calliopsis andreniformis TaxID=337506 RepID=UPI003FCE4854
MPSFSSNAESLVHGDSVCRRSKAEEGSTWWGEGRRRPQLARSCPRLNVRSMPLHSGLTMSLSPPPPPGTCSWQHDCLRCLCRSRVLATGSNSLSPRKGASKSTAATTCNDNFD